MVLKLWNWACNIHLGDNLASNPLEYADELHYETQRINGFIEKHKELFAWKRNMRMIKIFPVKLPMKLEAKFELKHKTILGSLNLWEIRKFWNVVHIKYMDIIVFWNMLMTIYLIIFLYCLNRNPLSNTLMRFRNLLLHWVIWDPEPNKDVDSLDNGRVFYIDHPQFETMSSFLNYVSGLVTDAIMHDAVISADSEIGDDAEVVLSLKKWHECLCLMVRMY